jgi:hypothetical protein
MVLFCFHCEFYEEKETGNHYKLNHEDQAAILLVANDNFDVGYALWQNKKGVCASITDEYKLSENCESKNYHRKHSCK